jgi:hypothetical protein
MGAAPPTRRRPSCSRPRPTGYERIQNYRGSQITPDSPALRLRVVTAARLARTRRLEDRPADALAGPGAALKLHFHAKDVYIVLAARGR